MENPIEKLKDLIGKRPRSASPAQASCSVEERCACCEQDITDLNSCCEAICIGLCALVEHVEKELGPIPWPKE